MVALELAAMDIANAYTLQLLPLSNCHLNSGTLTLFSSSRDAAKINRLEWNVISQYIYFVPSSSPAVVTVDDAAAVAPSSSFAFFAVAS